MDPEPVTPAPGADPADRSLVDDLRQLALDARAFATAEVAYQQSRAKVVGSSVGGIALRGVLAIALAFFALMALVVGAVIALVPVLTAWGATAAVFVVLLLASVGLALSARSAWQRLAGLIGGEGTGE